eukprot:330029_1
MTEEKNQVKQEQKTREDEVRWLALESNPKSANKFSLRMGLPANSFAFYDIYGFDDELLSFIPKPIIAVICLFPGSDAIKAFKKKQEEQITQQPQFISKNLFYMYQHARNACGTVA